jgi:hypothetical protein
MISVLPDVLVLEVVRRVSADPVPTFPSRALAAASFPTSSLRTVTEAGAQPRPLLRRLIQSLLSLDARSGIVEAKSHGADLTYLLNSSQGSPEEPPRVMSLFEVIRAIKFAEQDGKPESTTKWIHELQPSPEC